MDKGGTRLDKRERERGREREFAQRREEAKSNMKTMKAKVAHCFESRPGPGPSSLSLSRSTTRAKFSFGLARSKRSFGERKVDTTYKDTRRQSLLALESPENVGPVEDTVATFAESVSVSVVSLQTSRNLRELTASTYIDAPIESVWDTLTSYETLNEFIPGMICLLLSLLFTTPLTVLLKRFLFPFVIFNVYFFLFAF